MREYLKYYIGQRVKCTSFANKNKTEYGTLVGLGMDMCFVKLDNWQSVSNIKPEDVTLMLRDIESMLDEDELSFIQHMNKVTNVVRDDIHRSFINLKCNDEDRYAPFVYYHSTHWFLSNGFDIYQLIKNGHAIDAATMPSILIATHQDNVTLITKGEM